MVTGDAYSSGHLVPSHLGLAYVLLVETNPFSRTCIFSRLFTSNIPRYFLDFASELLTHGYRYHKLRKTFGKFSGSTLSFYPNLLRYRFKNIFQKEYLTRSSMGNSHMVGRRSHMVGRRSRLVGSSHMVGRRSHMVGSSRMVGSSSHMVGNSHMVGRRSHMVGRRSRLVGRRSHMVGSSHMVGRRSHMVGRRSHMVGR